MLVAKSGEEERRLFAVQWHSSVADLVPVAGQLCQPPRTPPEGSRVESVNPIVIPPKTCGAFGSRRNSLATLKPRPGGFRLSRLFPLEPTSDATDLNRAE